MVLGKKREDMTEEEEAELDEYLDQKYEQWMKEKIPGLLKEMQAAGACKLNFDPEKPLINQ